MELFSLENLVALAMLVLLQAVLGFDNLLYISLESKRAPLEQQAMVRRLGIGLAVLLRIVLLFVLLNLISLVQEPLFGVHFGTFIDAEFNLHALIVLLGGAFILYTAMKEILHMMTLEESHEDETATRSTALIIASIVIMNAVFSVDSILSAMALTDVFAVMATAIVIGGILMIWLADRVSEFLQKNRMYEVLGLFILFVVGVMLVTEGAHLAHMSILGEEIQVMTKTTFYFVIFVLVLTDIVQSRYQIKLSRMKQSLGDRLARRPKMTAPKEETVA
ncbi:MAG: tellurium resistance protein TerC [Pseudomonadota bacterium]